MPVCIRPVSTPGFLWSLALMLVLSACGQPSTKQRFEIQNVDLKWSNGRLNTVLSQKLILSAAAREALQNGVPLNFTIEFIVRNMANQTRVKEELNHYEIRYLPLSERFQLTLPGGEDIKTFPRLRHLLADLSDLRVSLRTGALPQGDYEVLTRTRLDKRKMPISMRLPTMFSADWKHDSGWSSWPLEISDKTG